MQSKNVLALAAAAAVALVLISERQPQTANEDVAALQTKAAALVKDYGGGLLGVLKGAMESSGPVGAVTFCNKEAPELAAEASQRSGWHIARTSLKVRNPQSAPDDYERQVMTEFVNRIAAGEPAASLKRAEIVEHNGERVFRYIQAIPTGELCLNCHGSDIKANVRAKIQELYPADQATGFKPGELRGVFTLSKTL